LLQFDLLLRSVFPIDDSVFGPNGGPAYTVLLSNGTSISGSTAPQPDGAYSEGQFYYSGAAFSGAVVSFFNGTDAGGSPVGEFGLDNLTFSAAEPASALGLGTALLVLGIIGRRRRSR
jgi:hypothetical protein